MRLGIMRRRGLGSATLEGITGKTAGDVVYWTASSDPQPEVDVILRWGCTAQLAPAPATPTVLNAAGAIHLAHDKSAARRMFAAAGLCDWPWLTPDGIRFPVVVRPRYHAEGRRLFVVDDPSGLAAAIPKCGNGWYASPIFDKKKEFRVLVVQGRAVWVARKVPPEGFTDFAWNGHRGVPFYNVRWGDWPIRVVKASIKAANLVGLWLAGVDVMEDGDGKVFVLEANSGPTITSHYRQTCVAKVLDWVLENGSTITHPDPGRENADSDDWQGLKHPAI